MRGASRARFNARGTKLQRETGNEIERARGSKTAMRRFSTIQVIKMCGPFVNSNSLLSDTREVSY